VTGHIAVAGAIDRDCKGTVEAQGGAGDPAVEAVATCTGLTPNDEQSVAFAGFGNDGLLQGVCLLGPCGDVNPVRVG